MGVLVSVYYSQEITTKISIIQPTAVLPRKIRRRNATRVHGVTSDKEVQVTRRCRVRRVPAQPKSHNELI